MLSMRIILWRYISGISGKKSKLTLRNTVAVHIRHIREKIEINPKEPRYLKVVWGIGYKMEDIKVE